MANVFLCSPTHNGQIDYRMASAFFINATQKHSVMNMIQQSSLLAHSCNQLLCHAINLREKHDLTWFAMLHSDIVPEKLWLDKLIDIAEEKGADVLSAIVPIKSEEGVTSTAISGEENFGAAFRFTQSQINYEGMLETFSIEDLLNAGLLNERYSGRRLLVNTGCMVCRLDEPAVRNAWFAINDRITMDLNNVYAEVESEDWSFSRLVAEEGGKVMATRAVKTQHMGMAAFHSDKVWGNAIDKQIQ